MFKTGHARRRVLLLCDDWKGHANTILDHIDAFRRLSRHQVKIFNPIGMRRSVALNFDDFDAVVVHYSLVLSADHYVSQDFREMLRRYRGLKIQFIQDDYRWVDRATKASRDAGIGVLFTAVREPAAGQLYDERLPGVRRVQTLTGFVPDSLRHRPLKPLQDRTIDVGYRGRDLPFWLGRLTQEKRWIGQGFLNLAPAFGLNCDIGWGESDRIYGNAWIDFIARCRATLAAESGASIADFDGSVEQAVSTYLAEHPTAPYEEVHGAVLRPYEGNVVANVISPRVFEAAALGTALVMFPGEYSGILVAGEDYIPLEKDFSNMGEVASHIKDDKFLSTLTARAHEHLVASGRWSYSAFIRQFDDVVSEEVKAPARGFVPPRYRIAKLERLLVVPPLQARLVSVALNQVSAITGRQFSARTVGDLRAMFAKGTLGVRATLGDEHLRRVYREGRRAGIPRASLLEELLKLSLLRWAACGRLRTADRFTVTSELDAKRGLLRFVSNPDDGSHRVTSSPPGVREALLSGTLNVVEWDHRAMGATVRLQKPRVELGIGDNGLRRFPLLVEIGRRKPPLLGLALLPIVGPADVSASRLG